MCERWGKNKNNSQIHNGKKMVSTGGLITRKSGLRAKYLILKNFFS